MFNRPPSLRLFTLILVLFSLTACNVLKPQSTDKTSTGLTEPLPDYESDEFQVSLEESGNLEAKITEEISKVPEDSYDDIWARIRNGYGLPSVTNPQIDAHLKWYSNNQAHIDRVTERSERYLHFVVSEMERNNMPLELALLPMIESSYDPFAYSRAKAAGIWQFVSGTGKNFGLKQNWWYDGRRDVVASTDAAIRYLQRLHNMFDNDWLLALAAYNCGEGRVRRAILKNQKAGKPTDFWSLTLPKETRSYVPHILALSRIISTPEVYDVALHDIPNDPYFTQINLESQIDLMQAARLADIDLKELQHLNAGYNRWLTNPSGAHILLVPVADAENFTNQLDNMPKLPPISWSEHKVVKGDVLGSIARRYKTTVDAIKSVNRLQNNNIRIGQVLLVPSAMVSMPEHTSSEELMYSYGKKAPGTGAQYHTVRSGDNLWTIARRYNTSVNTITRLNNLSAKTLLKPGQKLLVSNKANISVDKTVTTEDGLQKLVYQIQRGDTLYSIANRFRLSTKDILSWNSVKDASYIHPGQSLTLYVHEQHVN
jgi:membrane-bound lytic murein transglycosylase D